MCDVSKVGGGGGGLSWTKSICEASLSTKFLSTCRTEEDKARTQFIYLILWRIQNLLWKLEKQDTQHILVACTRSLR